MFFVWFVLGRQIIEHTKKLVEERFTTTGGYDHNAEVDFLFFVVVSDSEIQLVLYLLRSPLQLDFYAKKRLVSNRLY